MCLVAKVSKNVTYRPRFLLAIKLVHGGLVVTEDTSHD